MLRSLISLWIVAAVSFSARGDIVFFDLNDSPGEIAAARRAAAARKEQLIVLSGDPVGKRVPGGDGVARQLEDLAKRNVNVTSVVLSGHNGNGSFFGSKGRLSAKSLARELGKHPNLRDGVRSMMLAGCYTGTLGAIDFNWRQVAPNAALISGYDGSAPLGGTKIGHDYVEDVLKKEKALIEARDEKQLSRAFKGLRGVRQLNASLCVNDWIASSRGGVRSAARLRAECGPLINSDQLRNWNERYDCYRRGDTSCPEVPADTRGGELRRIYNEVHAVDHCREYLEETSRFPLPRTDELIRLVLSRDVVKNVERIHAAEIADINRALNVIGRSDLDLSGLSGMNRREQVLRIERAESALSRPPLNALTGPDGTTMAKGLNAVQGLEETVRRLSPGCVPFDWVEPGAGERSPCFSSKSPRELQPLLLDRYELMMELSGDRSIFAREAERLRAAGQENSEFMHVVQRRIDDQRRFEQQRQRPRPVSPHPEGGSER